MNYNKIYIHKFIELVLVDDLSEYKEVGFIFRTLKRIGRGKYKFHHTGRCGICDQPKLEHDEYIEKGIIKSDKISDAEINPEKFYPKVRLNSQLYNLDGELVILTENEEPEIK